MTDNSYNNWASMSDKVLVEHIGAYVKHHRLAQNKSQETLAQAAGISRSTLSLLERGDAVTLATLMQVLRVLDQLHIMEAFVIPKTFSPLALAKMEKEKRQRASSNKKNETGKSDW